MKLLLFPKFVHRIKSEVRKIKASESNLLEMSTSHSHFSYTESWIAPKEVVFLFLHDSTAVISLFAKYKDKYGINK